MIVTLEEVKNYLRVDIDDDDELISTLMQSAQNLCMDIARIEDETEFDSAGEVAKIAVLYSTAYFFENREESDYHSLTLRLRALLQGLRKAEF